MGYPSTTCIFLSVDPAICRGVDRSVRTSIYLGIERFINLYIDRSIHFSSNFRKTFLFAEEASYMLFIFFMKTAANLSIHSTSTQWPPLSVVLFSCLEKKQPDELVEGLSYSLDDESPCACMCTYSYIHTTIVRIYSYIHDQT